MGLPEEWEHDLFAQNGNRNEKSNVTMGLDMATFAFMPKFPLSVRYCGYDEVLSAASRLL